MLTHHLRPLSSPLKPPPLTVYPEEKCVIEEPPCEVLVSSTGAGPVPRSNQLNLSGLWSDPDRLLLIGLILLLWDSAPLELILALCYIML